MLQMQQTYHTSYIFYTLITHQPNPQLHPTPNTPKKNQGHHQVKSVENLIPPGLRHLQAGTNPFSPKNSEFVK